MSPEQRAEMEMAHGWSAVNHSPNMGIFDHSPLTIYRAPHGQTTDAAVSTQGYKRGLHVFGFDWRVTARGSHPSVGE